MKEKIKFSVNSFIESGCSDNQIMGDLVPPGSPMPTCKLRPRSLAHPVLVDRARSFLRRTVLNNVMVITLALVSTLFFTACDIDKQAAQDMQKIYDKVAVDAVKKLNIAGRNGATYMDLCVQTMLVSASYLQAQDEPNYSFWKGVEKDYCAAAGTPSQEKLLMVTDK